jgi:cell division protein FtsQ
MKEQTVTARSKSRVAASNREFVQRPVRRERAMAASSGRNPLRALYAYVPSALKFVVVLAVLVALFLGYRAAASASLFQVRKIDVTGSSRTSAEEIAGVTRRAVARTGVWRADLSAVSADLQRLPGVRRATVTRVLPDGLRVRVTERVPIAVVRVSSGHLIWVDDEGVAMGEMKPADRMPTFFIRGWAEEESPEAARDNLDRIQKYLQLVREWDALSLSERVSEVNLNDLKDVRAQLAGNDSQIEVRLGGENQGRRLKEALEVLDEEKQTVRTEITYIDFNGGRRISIGLNSGRRLLPGSEDASVETSPPGPPASTGAAKKGAAAKPDRPRNRARNGANERRSHG